MTTQLKLDPSLRYLLSSSDLRDIPIEILVRLIRIPPKYINLEWRTFSPNKNIWIVKILPSQIYDLASCEEVQVISLGNKLSLL